MKNTKTVIISVIIASLLMFNGCKKATAPSDDQPALSPTITPASSPVASLAITKTPSDEELSIEELSMDAYDKFLRNEAAISFDRFMPKGYFANSDGFFKEPLFEQGQEYTLLEILERITAYYFEYSENKKINYIDYGYIDCGKDEVSDLILRFNGMNIDGQDDDSTLVYIIKYINGKLYLCYCFETWSRSESSINEYGYYTSSGSGGASNHITEYGLIDKDGNWQPIVSIESESDINNSLQFNKLARLANAKGITNIIQVDTILFDYNDYSDIADEPDDNEYFYTFYVYDENWNPIDDPNHYTDSIYKDIFDEAKIPFIAPKKLSTMIAEKEEVVGATAEIKNGAQVTWKALRGDLFSDYIEK